MDWKETTKMEQKIKFINEWRSGRFTITELSRHFDISRPTTYKWIKRYKKKLKRFRGTGAKPSFSPQ